MFFIYRHTVSWGAVKEAYFKSLEKAKAQLFKDVKELGLQINPITSDLLQRMSKKDVIKGIKVYTKDKNGKNYLFEIAAYFFSDGENPNNCSVNFLRN